MSNLSQLFDAGRFPGGVEVRPDGKAAVMTLRGPENGSLRLFSLWEGVILSFNRIDTQVWPLAQAEANNILLLNFCQKGRCEVALDDGQFAFLSQGYMAVGTQQAQEEYCYPGSLYEGIELFLDLDALSRRRSWSICTPTAACIWPLLRPPFRRRWMNCGSCGIPRNWV